MTGRKGVRAEVLRGGDDGADRGRKRGRAEELLRAMTTGRTEKILRDEQRRSSARRRLDGRRPTRNTAADRRMGDDNGPPARKIRIGDYFSKTCSDSMLP
nr:unnamed protein product [Digitaria exilis]